MKSILRKIAALTLVLISFNAIAQFPGMNGGKPLTICRIYGKVVDAKTKKPVEFASVVLYKLGKDTIMGGMLAKENGDFAIENLPFGGYKLKIAFLGYSGHDQNVFLGPAKMEIDLGDIALKPDSAVALSTVSVVAEKSASQMSIDRKVYNVDKDLGTRGGTALDAVKNIPGVNVDVDGNATIRNSNALVYIDGRPSTLTLQQIPSDQIDRIEVITNPSVKFDAATSAGILNVVLKRNSKPGYNGMLMGSIGYPYRYTGMAMLAVKQNPWNFTFMVNSNYQKSPAKGFSNTDYKFNDSITSKIKQTNLTVMENSFNFGRIGVDYNIDNRNTISFSENLVIGKFATVDSQKSSTTDANDVEYFYGDKTNTQASKFHNYTTQFLYKRIYPKVGKELTADLNHNYTTATNGYQFLDNNYISSTQTVLPENPLEERNSGGTKAHQGTLQVDYVDPISETTKFEAGIRSFYKWTNSFNNTTYYDYSYNLFLRDTFKSNDYIINDMVNAAYVNYSSKIKNLGYQAGLRFEQSYYKGEITDKNQSFSYSYPSKLDNVLKSIFPAIYLSRKFGSKHEVQLNFSRKISRPDFFQMMPFIMFSSKNNYRIGNPQLKPEFINTSELNYNWNFGKGNWLSSAYFKYTEQPVSQSVYRSPADSTIIVSTSVNGKNQFVYGFENTIKYTFFKKLEVTGNGNVYYSILTSTPSVDAGEIVTRGMSWNSKLNCSYKFKHNITLQVNGNYHSPKVVIQGLTKPMYFMDISVNQMYKMKWIFNLSVSDVFNTKRHGAMYNTTFYNQEMARRREVRYVKLSVSFLFGKFDSSILKMRNRKGGQEQQGGGEQGLGF